MDMLSKLLNEKQRLSARLVELDRAISEYRALERKMMGLLGQTSQYDDAADSLSRPRDDTSNSESLGRSRQKAQVVADFEAAVRAILSEAAEPLERLEILDLLTARGIVVEGNPPANVVSARLSRMSDVEGRRGLGYWLKSRHDDIFGASDSPADDGDRLLDGI